MNIQNPTLPIVVSIYIDDIDFLAISSSAGYDQELFSLAREDPDDKALLVARFIEREIKKVGGEAVIEASYDHISCVWTPPAADVVKDMFYALYVAYMLQYGIFKNSEQLLADAAYKGGGKALASTLAMINDYDYNRYMVERDLFYLAGVVPRFAVVWLILGLVLIMNDRMADSKMVFEHLLEIEPDNIHGLKYMALTLTAKEPKKAAEFAERLLKELDRNGLAPDAHDRATCGFAFMKNRRYKDAKFQFELACGNTEPKMTLAQWLDWGHIVVNKDLAKRLMEP
jgi:tetratricopeptide (TPR) repeat protein